MGPKIEASIDFVKQTQGLAIITNSQNAIQAIQGKAGTRITPKFSILFIRLNLSFIF